ncbi:hypothetical protein D3C78_1736190 [compost metagenome]
MYALSVTPGMIPNRFCRFFANLYVVDSMGVPYKEKSMFSLPFQTSVASFKYCRISSANGVASGSV